MECSYGFMKIKYLHALLILQTNVEAPHLQAFIEAHFALQGIADPVDEGFRFLSRA